MIKNAQDVIRIARERGFEIRVDPGPPPMPALYLRPGTKREDATEVLLGALKAWRLEIIEIVLREQEKLSSVSESANGQLVG